jgi:hypothetical protein
MKDLLTSHSASIESKQPLCRNDPLMLIQNAEVLAKLWDTHRDISGEAIVTPEDAGE